MLRLVLIVVLVLMLLSFFGGYSGYLPLPYRIWRRWCQPYRGHHFACTTDAIAVQSHEPHTKQTGSPSNDATD